MWLTLFLFCYSILAAEIKKVELVANFPVDLPALNRALQKEELIVELSDLKEYKEAWKKKLPFFLRLFQKPTYADAPKILFWNINRPYRKLLDFSAFPKKQLILFLFEPPTQMERMYDADNLAHFSKIYTWDDTLVDNKKFFKFYYPVLQPMEKNLPSFSEKKLCTLIASNKKSSHPKELYSERRKVIDFFENREGDDFDFYGNFWDPKTFKHCGGKLLDKQAALKGYRFAICYENMQGVHGYVSEKIFDCFAAGVVPIYWGAVNITDFVPADCFIDKRNFSSIEGLYQFLKAMSEEEYAGYLHRISTFLESDSARLFSAENFHKIVAESLR